MRYKWKEVIKIDPLSIHTHFHCVKLKIIIEQEKADACSLIPAGLLCGTRLLHIVHTLVFFCFFTAICFWTWKLVWRTKLQEMKLQSDFFQEPFWQKTMFSHKAYCRSHTSLHFLWPSLVPLVLAVIAVVSHHCHCCPGWGLLQGSSRAPEGVAASAPHTPPWAQHDSNQCSWGDVVVEKGNFIDWGCAYHSMLVQCCWHEGQWLHCNFTRI